MSTTECIEDIKIQTTGSDGEPEHIEMGNVVGDDKKNQQREESTIAEGDSESENASLSSAAEYSASSKEETDSAKSTVTTVASESALDNNVTNVPVVPVSEVLTGDQTKVKAARDSANRLLEDNQLEQLRLDRQNPVDPNRAEDVKTWWKRWKTLTGIAAGVCIFEAARNVIMSIISISLPDNPRLHNTAGAVGTTYIGPHRWQLTSDDVSHYKNWVDGLSDDRKKAIYSASDNFYNKFSQAQLWQRVANWSRYYEDSATQPPACVYEHQVMLLLLMYMAKVGDQQFIWDSKQKIELINELGDQFEGKMSAIYSYMSNHVESQAAGAPPVDVMAHCLLLAMPAISEKLTPST